MSTADKVMLGVGVLVGLVLVLTVALHIASADK